MSISRACRLLGARRQGYYEWYWRKDHPKGESDRLLTISIKDIFFENRRIYGARKIQAKLREEGTWTSRKRIRRLMLCEGLVPITYRRHMNTTDSKTTQRIFPNLLKQNFCTEAVNRVWVSDMTYIPTDEGWLYLCSMMDLYSRRVVGWAVSKRIDRFLAISAFKNAVKNRNPGKGLILHTDRGCQYASSDFRAAVAGMGGIQSMSHPGNPYDNACAESFFKAIKVECLHTMHLSTRTQATNTIQNYLLYYNCVRIHAFLGYLSPVNFENRSSGSSIAS
jgi:putative transposase